MFCVDQVEYVYEGRAFTTLGFCVAIFIIVVVVFVVMFVVAVLYVVIVLL